MPSPFKGNILSNLDDSAETPGGIVVTRREITDADVTVTTADHDIVFVGTLTAPRTVTFPAASTLIENRMFNVKDETGLADRFNITLAFNGSDTIENEDDALIDRGRMSLTVYTDAVSNFSIK